MINYSSERQKSRKSKKRPQRKETSYRSRIVNPSWPPKSTHNKYGSIDSPIRENRAYPRHPGGQKGHSWHNVQSRISPAAKQERTSKWQIYRYWANDIYLVVGYGVPFRLGLSPAWFLYTPHKTHQQNTQRLQISCRLTSKTPAQHTLLPIIFCLLSKGLHLVHLRPCAKLLPKQMRARLTNLCWSIAPTLNINTLRNIEFD